MGKDKNVWANIDFKDIAKKVDSKVKLESKRYSEYIDIIHEELLDAFGETNGFEFGVRPSGKTISLSILKGSHYHLDTIYMSNENEFVLFTRDGLPIELDSKVFFRKMTRYLIKESIVKKVKSYYEDGFIELPSKLKAKSVDLSKITIELFTTIFEELSESEMNGETVEDVVINDTDDGKEIIFSIDCGRLDCTEIIQ